MSAYGHEDLDDEEAELDRIAARDRDDDPRADLGYQPAPAREPALHPTLEPRSVKPPPGAGHWAITWIAGEEAPAGTVGGGPHTCSKCSESTPILHAIGSDPRRRFCGKCQGEAVRERVGWAQAAEPTEKGGRER